MENILSQIGLTKKQEKIYSTLLELGETSITKLSKKAEIKRPTTYLIVDELYMLGLVSQTKKGRNNIISPVHPRRLLQIAQFRAKTIDEKLPELVALYNTPKDKPKIQVFEGIQGVKDLYKEVHTSLNNKEEMLVFTRIDAIQKIPGVMEEVSSLLKTVKNPRIRELNYENDEGEKWFDEMKKYRGKNHFVRTIPKKFELGFTDNFILENKLVIFSLSSDIFVIVIESEQIAKTYRSIFELAWACAE